MRSLKKKFKGKGEVQGYEFIQVYATNRAFLYQVSINGSVTHFEVFMRKINTQYDCISYPRSKSFGLWAWTYRSYEEALNKFDQLNNKKRS